MTRGAPGRRRSPISVEPTEVFDSGYYKATVTQADGTVETGVNVGIFYTDTGDVFLTEFAENGQLDNRVITSIEIESKVSIDFINADMSSSLEGTSFASTDDPDSPTAVTQIYLGNIADINTFGDTSPTENAAGILGNYSDISAETIDYQTSPGNPNIPGSGGFLDQGDPMIYDVGNGPQNTTIDGFARYVADITLADGTVLTGVDVAVIQAPNGDAFLETWVYADFVVLDQPGRGDELLEQPITNIVLTDVSSNVLDAKILNGFPATTATGNRAPNYTNIRRWHCYQRAREPDLCDQHRRRRPRWRLAGQQHRRRCGCGAVLDRSRDRRDQLQLGAGL